MINAGDVVPPNPSCHMLWSWHIHWCAKNCRIVMGRECRSHLFRGKQWGEEFDVLQPSWFGQGSCDQKVHSFVLFVCVCVCVFVNPIWLRNTECLALPDWELAWCGCALATLNFPRLIMLSFIYFLDMCLFFSLINCVRSTYMADIYIYIRPTDETYAIKPLEFWINIV